jgi:hypothetical protein
MRSKPLSAATTIVGPEQPTTTMMLDAKLPGAYEVQLDVTDAAGAKNCAPARATIVATPAEKLLVEMVWDNSETDIDLHVLRTPDARMGESPDDCHYANLKPDWGAPMVATDDPLFKLDALTGYGPELFGYADPAPNTYRLAVVANGTSPARAITVRSVRRSGQFTQLSSAAAWAVADIEWPSGTVTAVPSRPGMDRLPARLPAFGLVRAPPLFALGLPAHQRRHRRQRRDPADCEAASAPRAVLRPAPAPEVRRRFGLRAAGQVCAENEQCPAGSWCKQGLCLDRAQVSLCPGGQKSECGQGERCNTVTTVCEEDLGCSDNGDCSPLESATPAYTCVPAAPPARPTSAPGQRRRSASRLAVRPRPVTPRASNSGATLHWAADLLCL